jgi:hypothetical protein
LGTRSYGVAKRRQASERIDLDQRSRLMNVSEGE